MGIAYGAFVNAVSRYRSNADDAGNHAIATLLTFPILGVYAKANKLQHGVTTAIWLSGLMALFKFCKQRDNPIAGRHFDHGYNRSAVFADHWKRSQ
jgi:hypothetical protein